MLRFVRSCTICRHAEAVACEERVLLLIPTTNLSAARNVIGRNELVHYILDTHIPVPILLYLGNMIPLKPPFSKGTAPWPHFPANSRECSKFIDVILFHRPCSIERRYPTGLFPNKIPDYRSVMGP